ncbi:MAG: uroporphyrinogen-III C-methyltransferase [Rhodospirillales bacterium]|jgi:uroporphyrin-III C-methyltransferase
MTGPLHPEFRPGEVWLVGAGPGDPGLLTLRAVHALSTADVIVHDALIDARVLAMARPGAVLEPMGKRGGRPSPRQAEITARLLERARQGLRVLRLKGGDPYVFGRGGEEAVALLAAGVPVRVVPGVTAGLGGLAAAGIPATMRETNQAVILATGHLADHDPDSPEGRAHWTALARTGQPIVIYMGMANLPGIVAALLEGGLPPATPAAVVGAATLPEQTVLETDLGRVVAAAAGIAAPAIVAVGAIVGLRAVLGRAG